MYRTVLLQSLVWFYVLNNWFLLLKYCEQTIVALIKIVFTQGLPIKPVYAKVIENQMTTVSTYNEACSSQYSLNSYCDLKLITSRVMEELFVLKKMALIKLYLELWQNCLEQVDLCSYSFCLLNLVASVVTFCSKCFFKYMPFCVKHVWKGCQFKLSYLIWKSSLRAI